MLDEIRKEEILKILHEHYPNLAERDLQEEMATHGTLMSFEAGDILMDYGSYIKHVPLIISGTIKVTREDQNEGKEMILYFLSGGETCSMSFSCCMMNKKSVIRTEAIDDTVILAIPIKYLDVWMNKFQSWKNFIMMSYDQKMTELVRVIDSIAFEGLDERLCKYLLARIESTGSGPSINITHQEIANDLNSSREAISRLLKKLENQGKVKLHRNRVEMVK